MPFSGGEMSEIAAALGAGIAVAVAVMVLGGGPGRPRAVESWVRREVGHLAVAESRRAGASGLDLGRLGMLAVEGLVACLGAAAGYLATGMPSLAVAAGAMSVGILLGALGLRATAIRRERQDGVVAAVRTLRQLLETGAVGVTSALEILAERGPEQLRREFGAIVVAGGREAAWAAARARVAEPVFDLLSAAILVQRPGGGELGPLFRELEESVTAAYEVEREAAALQVQARSASTLILILPLAFLEVMCLLRSPYLDVYRTFFGQVFLATMLAVMGAAHVLIRRWLRLPEEPRLELVDA
jgi:Flp pilus assembly protein TadB